MSDPVKILVAPDKFKGSLSAREVAAAIADGLRSVWGDAEIICCPIADGGEGTAEVLCGAFGGSWREVPVQDPLGRTIPARYCLSDQDVAVMEMSEASGMRRMEKGELDPLCASTFGTGQLIRAALASGVNRIIIGLGGSATNDGGIGMAAALGYRFLKEDGSELAPIPSSLRDLSRIERPKTLVLPEIVAAVDVGNPLLGPEGATRVFGPQKGADENQVEELEAGLAHLADLVERDLGCQHREVKGAGAAGGLGFGLLSFCGAKIRPGFELVAEALELQERIGRVDLVITAEGQIDAQTLHGKGPAGIAALARISGKPVIALAGSVRDEEQLTRVFDAIVPVVPGPMALDDAVKETPRLLTAAAARTARILRICRR